MENDFDEGEFYYRNRKEKRARTKDDFLYGIFASGDSSESDYEERRGKKQRKKDISVSKKPVYFVSTAAGSSIMANQEIDSDLKEKSMEVGDVGSFEKHTKGIGMKLLEKMGYKGGGLGKNEQGITVPIEPKLRPKNMGMGFNHYKKTNVSALQDSEVKSAPLPVQPLESHKREKPWLKQASKKKLYITAEELLPGKQDVVQKVIDMRGPQVRVLTNLENLNAVEEKARENDIPMPKLERNVWDIQKTDLDLRNEREKEKEKFQAEAVYQKKQLENMEAIVNELDRIDEESKAGTLTLDLLVNTFLDLQQCYAYDYKLRNLSSIACSYALPLFIRVFQGWDPLQNPTHGLEIVSLWKNLLQDNSFGFSDSDMASSYSQLFMKVIFHAVRISVTNTWQARDPEPMLRFLDSWEKLLPPVVLQTILDNIVLPKLSAAVDSWDPRRETIPIHSWIHPWLPLLGQKLETCYQTIRCRLQSVLHAWHPSDMSAYYILSPWKNVFDPRSWEKLMVRFIVPKLLSVMQEFQVNPANQNLDQFYWVRTWATAISIHHMLPLMDIFFKKWQEVLYHWLCSNPNFEEVTKWFLGWMELLPPELLANDHIRYRLFVGLDMVNQAAKGMEVVQPSLREKRQFETRKKGAAQAQQHASVNFSGGLEGDGEDSVSKLISLKEIIEAHGQQNGLLLMPKPGRIHDGHQIYSFGSITIIIDSLNDKAFAHTEDKWSPVSLELLLELHNRYGLKRPQ